jgi:Fe2+ transport system protein FeoA
VLTLSNLQHGDRGIIVAIDAEDPHTSARLAARGIVPGTSLGVLRAGDPILIGIDNERWAINRNEAASIHIDLEPRRRRSLFSLLRRP